MKKEVILAIIIGFAIGLIITLGIYTAQKAFLEQQKNKNTSDQSTTPQDSQNSHIITITSPENELVFDQDTLVITGTSTPNSYIIALVGDQEYLTETQESGSFDLEVELLGGANIISITSIDESGNEASTQLTAVYSTAKLDQETKSPEPESTDDQEKTNE